MVLRHPRKFDAHMHSLLVSTAGIQTHTLRRHHGRLQGVPALVLIWQLEP